MMDFIRDLLLANFRCSRVVDVEVYSAVNMIILLMKCLITGKTIVASAGAVFDKKWSHPKVYCN